MSARKKPKEAVRDESATEDRKQRILEAALHEFAKRGFEAASTNAIAEHAGVAKGLVFHYFEDKEKLFEAVFTSVIELYTRELERDEGPLPSDLFERMHVFLVKKLQVARQSPDTYQFLMVAIQEAPVSLRTKLMTLQAKHSARYLPKLLAGIDVTKLRSGVSLERAFHVIMLLSEGIFAAYLARSSMQPDRGAGQLEQMAKEQWSWFELLRDGLYDRGELDEEHTRKNHT